MKNVNLLVLLIGCLIGPALLGKQTAHAQTSEPISLTTAEGLVLEGTLTLPAGTAGPVPVILFIAGSGPTDRNGNSGVGLQSNAYALLADSLAQRGVAMVRYDKRFSGSNLQTALKRIKPQAILFDSYVADAVGFARMLQADRRFGRVYVAGHSEGSLVGMLAARQLGAAGFISLAGAGRNIADVLKTQFESAIPATERQAASLMLDTLRMNKPVNVVPMSLLMIGFGPMNQPFLRSWMQYDPAVEITRYKGPVLIVQGDRDVQVAVSEAERLRAARPDARYVLVSGMSHILKEGPTDRAANIKTYNDPTRPLIPGLAQTIATFVGKE
ncbi:alpha/beta fold hydrolase [Rudanella paleaurantiibacter]|uniref:Alpha/beta fold hydrolase n=1 Tax=Rudanella paleaurantiibacter TaxID=2614655 RepID=A0A7J5TY85_9BACT|nr:alpha/beta fold hydrolase [Rudanella paleaurantiibacter]KAB7730025.1 alpha/beta fold hydrolase [Rudanella paleaurantiibacter]